MFEETTTETVTENCEYKIVGELTRQYFVIDPITDKMVFVNKDDDLYRDDENKIWKIV